MSSALRPLMLSATKSALKSYTPRALSGTSYASVAVILCEHAVDDAEPTPHVLLIRRAQHPGDPWSGHLAFPGGRKDPGDVDSLHTAVRETREEIGLELDPSQHWIGRLDPLAARGSRATGLVIEPFVFEIPHRLDFQPDPREVAQVFWVPIAPLMRGEKSTTIEVIHNDNRYRLPGYLVGEQVLWGMTYEMFQALARLSRWLA